MRSLSPQISPPPRAARALLGELFARKVCLTRLFVVSCSPLSLARSRDRGLLPLGSFYRRTGVRVGIPTPRRCHACTAAAHAPPGCKKLSFDLWRAALEGTNKSPPRMLSAPGARALPLGGLPEGTLISRGDTAAAHRMIPWNGSCKHCVFSFARWSLRWYFSCRSVTRILIVQGLVYG